MTTFLPSLFRICDHAHQSFLPIHAVYTIFFLFLCIPHLFIFSPFFGCLFTFWPACEFEFHFYLFLPPPLNLSFIHVITKKKKKNPVFPVRFWKCHFLLKHRHSFQLQKGYTSFWQNSWTFSFHLQTVYYISNDVVVVVFYPESSHLPQHFRFMCLAFFSIWTGWEVKRKW
jgi:hypothetical protein